MNDCELAVPTRDDFISGFEKLESSTELWSELFRCKHCGQYWVVEEGAEMDRRSNKAYKIESPEHWKSHDTKPARTKFAVERHGGLSAQKCIYAGCNAFALKNMYLCPEHSKVDQNW